MEEKETYETLKDYLRLRIQKSIRQIIRNYSFEVNDSVKDIFENEDGYPEEWIQKLKDEFDDIFEDTVYSIVPPQKSK